MYVTLYKIIMKKKIILFYPHIEAFGGIERLILSLIKKIYLNTTKKF